MEQEKQMSCEEEKEIPLEELFQELETVIGRLESETVNLEEAFSLYHKGMNLLKSCNNVIDKVEKKVLILDEDGGTDEF